jgi:hypothetical protein
MVVGIGLCAPAYWCTDFLLVQRALAAKIFLPREDAARGRGPKMFPGLVTVQA